MCAKRYGLILPNKSARNKSVISKTSVFGNDDDDEDSPKSLNLGAQKDSKSKAFIKRQAQIEIEKAIATDPTVYEYDNIYDDIQAKKASADNRVETSSTERKPKYIENLLKAAEQRKRELERRIEKTVQKEREAEKGLYDDKEAFVTDAYRQKMEQIREEEAKERLKDEMEAKNDVTKQSDLTSFYRNLLNQTSGEQASQPTSVVIKEEKAEQKLVEAAADDRDDGNVHSDGSVSESDARCNRVAESQKTNYREKINIDRKSRENGDQRKTGHRGHSSDSESHHRRHHHRHDGSSDERKKTKKRHGDSPERRGDRSEKRHRRHRHSSSDDDESRSRSRRKNKDAASNVERNDEKESKLLETKTGTSGDSESIAESPMAAADNQPSNSAVNSSAAVDPVSKAKPQPDTSRKIVGSTLDSAKERYLARKALLKAPIVKEDSD